MEQISTIIVDDEPLAREGLAIRMKAFDDFNVLAECANGLEALEVICGSQPDVVFLDIEMPGLNGLELIKSLNQQNIALPKIVFVTAFPDFAIQAFDQQAFDYLLKPFSEERLTICLEQLRNDHLQNQALSKQQKLDRLLYNKTGRSLDGFINTLEHSKHTNLDELQQTISLKSGTEWLRIRLDSILWIEAAGDYMCVHTREGTHIIRKTLRQFENELDKQNFPRISRSAIVNLNKVSKFTPNSNGEYIAHLSTGDQVKVSRLYKMKLDELQTVKL